MATGKLEYGTAGVDFTITMASLGDGAFRESTAVDNTADLFIDVLVGGSITVGTSPTADTQIVIYAYGSVEGTTRYSGNVTGVDAAYAPTLNEDQNLKLLDVISTHSTSDTAYEWGPASVQSSLGQVARSWGIVVKNESGVALNSTEGNHIIEHNGTKFQSS